MASAMPAPGKDVDIVVVGAGIVGLMVAQQLLQRNMSVALVEQRQPCAGATGAGQGYLWMAHRQPGSVGWALAARSMALWRRALAADEDLAADAEWQPAGSILLATSPEEGAALAERQLQLNAHALRASFLDRQRLAEAEPSLVLPPGSSGGLLVESDAQINGRKAAHALLERCRRCGPAQFSEHMDTQVLGVDLAPALGPAPVVSGRRVATTVRTPLLDFHARVGVVLAAGVWTGALLAAATGAGAWRQLLLPRRGHLLEVARPAGMLPLRHGVMEMSYTKHYSSNSGSSNGNGNGDGGSSTAQGDGATADITFTATTSASGSLLIGSSREFSGFETDASPAIVAAILRHASAFLPALASVPPDRFEASVGGLAAAGQQAPAGAARQAAGQAPAAMSVRVGLRPYAVGGLPLVGPVSGAPGLFVAAGHEGSGLCLGPATAELITRYVLQHVGATDAAAGPLDTRSFHELLPDVRANAAASERA